MHPIHFLTLPFAESHLNARNYPTSKETKETNLNEESKQTSSGTGLPLDQVLNDFGWVI